jgi:hypothetical protein
LGQLAEDVSEIRVVVGDLVERLEALRALKSELAPFLFPQDGDEARERRLTSWICCCTLESFEPEFLRQASSSFKPSSWGTNDMRSKLGVEAVGVEMYDGLRRVGGAVERVVESVQLTGRGRLELW